MRKGGLNGPSINIVSHLHTVQKVQHSLLFRFHVSVHLLAKGEFPVIYFPFLVLFRKARKGTAPVIDGRYQCFGAEGLFCLFLFPDKDAGYHRCAVIQIPAAFFVVISPFHDLDSPNVPYILWNMNTFFLGKFLYSPRKSWVQGMVHP